MDFPSIMVSRSEKRSRGRADRIGSSRWMVVEDPAPAMAKQGLSGGALDDPDAEESERSDALARGGVLRFFRVSGPITYVEKIETGRRRGRGPEVSPSRLPASSLPRVPARLLPVAPSPWWRCACAVPLSVLRGQLRDCRRCLSTACSRVVDRRP